MNRYSAIISPMPRGCGAYVLHGMIESGMPDYKLVAYSPWLSLVPFVLPRLAAGISCRLVHTTPDYGLFFHRDKIPLVLTVHHYMCDPEIRKYSSFLQQAHYATDLKWFIRKSIQKCTMLTSVSNYSAQHIQNELELTRDIQVIYNGVDEKLFSPANRKRHSREVRALFSGNLTKRKGAQWLPDIAANLDRGIIVRFTSGLRHTKFSPKARNLFDLGRIDREHMPEVYRSSDILVSPTTREGFGLSIAEAMACGLPVVASNCSAVPELIDDGLGGFLCPVGDVKAFAEKINLLASTPELRRQMGEYNRAKVEKMFTMERMVSEYRELFDSLL
jgi:L-malate glycosyltransferase